MFSLFTNLGNRVSDIEKNMIERVADALYNEEVKQATAWLDKIEFDCSDLPEVIQRLVTETETAQVLVFASYLEDKFTQLFKLNLYHLDTKGVEDELFGSNGMLGNFGNRITLAYHLGWLSDEHRICLNTFRKMRNAYAHRAYRINRRNDQIASYLRVIDQNPIGLLRLVRKVFSDQSEPDPFQPESEIKEAQLIALNFAQIASRTYQEMLIFPTALRFQIHPNSFMGGWDSGPEILRQVHRELSRTALRICGTQMAETTRDQSKEAPSSQH